MGRSAYVEEQKLRELGAVHVQQRRVEGAHDGCEVEVQLARGLPPQQVPHLSTVSTHLSTVNTHLSTVNTGAGAAP